MWRAVYPCGIHFLISQVIANTALAVILYWMGGTVEDFASYTIFLTGISALLTMLPCVYFYKKDRTARVLGGLIPEKPGRKLTPGTVLLLLLLSAACSVFANILVAMLQNILNVQAYQENMEQIMSGKSFFMLIFWMGIIAPVAEEMVFRWLIYLRLRDHMKMAAAAVISGVFFGIYHMNLVQAVYAGILGIVFAYILELTGNLWSSVLLHMGANIWSLVMPELLVRIPEENYVMVVLTMEAVLLVVFTVGVRHLKRNAAKKRVI